MFGINFENIHDKLSVFNSQNNEMRPHCVNACRANGIYFES